MQLHQVANEIWIYDGGQVNFYGFLFPTRTTVVRLKNKDLWVHSPGKINETLRKNLFKLGTVKYLVSPNKLHHLFLSQWIEAYPEAIKYSAPGLKKKRADIEFNVELTAVSEKEWKTEIDQTIFLGSPAMAEVVFYHRLSKTLVLADLIQNFHSNTLNWWQIILARFAGILHPDGKMPIDWRLSFWFGNKKQAIRSLKTILLWSPENIILSHGECIFGGGTGFLRTSFAWLHKKA